MPEHAQACIMALADANLGDRISLGGAFGLLHYYDYRSTHDVEARWAASATEEDRQRVLQVLEDTLADRGPTRRRAWGDTASVELRQGGRTVFSFQIAHRSAQLEPSVESPWEGVLLDSFPDLVASKMVALVERGAPRDFRDIYALCQAGLGTPEACWQLWRMRQSLAGSDTDVARARLAIETHLTRLELHRPLSQIADPTARAEAERVRCWFREDLFRALGE